MSSYGHYQEQAAAHLLGLLQQPTRKDQQPLNAAAGTAASTYRHDVLALREQVRTALQERLALVGGGHHFEAAVEFSPERAASHGVHLLARVLHATPSDAEHQLSAGPPSELLTTTRSDVDRELWRQAARALTLGNHELYSEAASAEGGGGDGWAGTTDQRWAVLTHAAESVEALVVLDHRLRHQQLLDDLSETPVAWGPRGDRTVCAAVARQARQQIGAAPSRVTTAHLEVTADQAADHLTSHLLRTTPTVVMVQDTFEQLGLAEVNLARQLRYGQHRGPDLNEAQLSIRDGRTLLLGQVHLNGQLATLAAREHPDLRLGFEARSRKLLAAATSARHWVDAAASADRSPALHQQQEITLAARRLATWPAPWPAPSPAVLRQLDAAAHQASTSLAWTMRQQVGRGAHFISRTSTEDQTLAQANATPRYGALYNKLTDLAETPVPYASPLPAPIARTALRQALAETSTRTPGTRLRPTIPGAAGAAETTPTSAPGTARGSQSDLEL